jgi:MoxR-like ATPase
VPTVDTTRYTFLLDRIVRVRAPVLFCGESGTAKTVTIQNFFESLDLDFYQVQQRPHCTTIIGILQSAFVSNACMIGFEYQ